MSDETTYTLYSVPIAVVPFVALAGIAVVDGFGSEVITSGTCIAIMLMILKYFMKALDSRNEVIDKMNERMNTAIENNTRVVQEFIDEQKSLRRSITKAPCGEFIRKMEEQGGQK